MKWLFTGGGALVLAGATAAGCSSSNGGGGSDGGAGGTSSSSGGGASSSSSTGGSGSGVNSGGSSGSTSSSGSGGNSGASSGSDSGGSSSSGSAGDSGGLVDGTGTPCTANSDCPSGICQPVGGDAGGSGKAVCTTTCTTVADCVAGWTCAAEVGQSGYVCQCTSSPEVCDGKDDNCDGIVDNEPEADEACAEQAAVCSVCRSGTCVSADVLIEAGSPAACNVCIGANCCVELMACTYDIGNEGGSTNCGNILSDCVNPYTLDGGNLASAVAACAGGNATLMHYLECAESNCAAQCL